MPGQQPRLHIPMSRTTKKTGLTLAIRALIQSIVPVLVHGIEVLSPKQSRWVVNWVLPFFGVRLPDAATSLTCHDPVAMPPAAMTDRGSRPEEMG